MLQSNKSCILLGNMQTWATFSAESSDKINRVATFKAPSGNPSLSVQPGSPEKVRATW